MEIIILYCIFTYLFLLGRLITITEERNIVYSDIIIFLTAPLIVPIALGYSFYIED